ncbi:HD domain-containing phosphohydrolase [Conexibacter stalactiti]|uniref:Diguanylate cyclase n=1 Tax=Conexibacter stalactiti TaxID=1940611 RepID=A0ABU4HZM1_9ACTN|nr:HD domain-containing phosphohydrolase [Conexibacter stalactiti]MDW5598706.1 diguanylate cyclase [Conexibacter stalactiti]MEC5039348.1 HD domain-containing phosphohydrolase [Conexibacter stalactiti]
MTQSSIHRTASLLLWLSGAVIVASLLRTVLGIGDATLAEILYDVGIVAACLTWCLRAATPDPAHRAFVCGIAASLLWLAGAVFTAFEGNDAAFSVADVVMFGINPLIALAVVLYGRSAVPRPIPATRWVDALLSAFTVAAVGAALVIEGALASVESAAITAAVYPTGAVVLMAVSVGLLALRGWAFDRRFSLIVAGAATIVLTEVLYRSAQADGFTAEFGTLYDCGWMIGALLLALAAWQPQRPLPSEPRRTEIVVPIVLGAIALLVLIAEGSEADSSALTITLSGLAVATLLARMALSLTLNHRLLLHSRREAITDTVTGLGNSRRLVADLERLAGARATLVLLDLNGFKTYNDTFGHLAGDHLLRRIGAALERDAGSGARAYRMGGDEFCVLLPGDAAITPAALAAGAAQRGDGFTVTAAFGAVALPEEAAGSTAALRLADERMYAHKRDGGGRAQPVVDALLALIEAHDPELRRHADAVAERADATAAALGLGAAERREVRHAAALHDVGTLALPAAVTQKPGPLDDEERAFVEHHTIFGERVIATTPDLRAVATVVRASHERFDGTGYPDRLAAERIPLAARIVFACHAYDAIVTDRPHAAARSPDEAVAILRRCAGSSFDGRVVEALAGVLEEENSRVASRL